MIPSKIKMFFDGSCEPKNPGGVAGYAWIIFDENDQEIAAGSGEECRGDTATNNIAEWAAVKHGLQYLDEQNWVGQIDIKGDSQLVIYQLIGKYRVKKETLIPYHKACSDLLANWKWTAEWIPREQNEKCDRMSKKGSS